MFAKPPSFKPLAAIKNSERKNVLSKIEAQCSLGDITVEDKQLLLPKSVQAANALSHGNDKIVIYNDNGLPIWVLYKSQYVPTVALVARLPVKLQSQMLPIVYTVSRTLQYLQNGADFMTPGIFGDLPTIPVKKGSAVQIRDLESGSVMATGLALRDLSTITEEDSGKCVQTISVVGDKLTPNTTLTRVDLEQVLTESHEEEPLKEQDNVQEKKELAEPQAKEEIPQDVASQANAAEDITEQMESLEIEEELTPKEADDAFMYALQKIIRQPKHTYPMTMAGFAALLPANMPYEHPQLNIKNTTFKKMGKLLKNAEKLGLINCRDRQGGEVIVMSVNVPQNEMEPEQIVRKSKKPNENADKMAAQVKYKPKPSLRDIMDSATRSVELHDAGTLRKQVLAYVANHNLLNANQEINVDDLLRKALGLRQTVTTVKREELGTLAVRQCSPFYKIVGKNQSPDDVNWSKGNVPTITLKTERRGGNKVVTLVFTAGLHGFKINPQELSDELRHACAGSSTVTDVKGQEAIVVQGNHIAKIVRVLEKRGIKSSWIKQ